MKLGLRLLFGFFLITGLAAFFVLRVFVQEVRPSVRDVIEDTLVDTANILAELAREDLRRMPEGGVLDATPFAAAVRAYASRPVDAQIWGVSKQTLDLRIYVTDAAGRVVFDTGSAAGNATGADYSRWRDVALTLQGRYGARATREVRTDERTSVLFVAAPVRDGERVIGVVTVAKPLATVQKFIDRAERKIVVAGAWLLGLSLLVGVLFTAWVVHSVRRLRGYAQQVQFGARREPPRLSGELGELALAMGRMQERLEGREYLERTVRALTHELKSPMTAIAGAAELLHDDLPAPDRRRFAAEIADQVARQRTLVERMLELSKLEHRRSLEHAAELDFAAVADIACRPLQSRAAARGIEFAWARRDAARVHGEAELLALAVGNVLDNAVDFAPEDERIELTLAAGAGEATLSVRDRGPGVEDYALARLGQRFFSTPRPAGAGAPARKGSGLGLAIAAEVMALHGGRVEYAHAQPGLEVRLTLPTA
jgi:two-component system sensor histidine kinase CreC